MITDDVEQFRLEWNDSTTNTILVHTSGSTGTPKPFWAEKEKMANSARLTCNFLNLRPSDTALLCMPLKYIAGKMVVVRSIVGQLQLVCVEPCGHPLSTIDEHINFAALTPMQVYNTLQVPAETHKLSEIDNVIIGGGAIDHNMSQTLRSFPNRIYSTYGMTETLSHIAMRRISGPEASEWYTPFEHVKLSLSARNTLVIDAPLVANNILETNDIAQIDNSGKFRIIGRTDNTINTGGIKVQIEEVERLLQPHMKASFAITSAPDEKFGEIIVIVTPHQMDAETMKICQSVLPHIWVPKRICHSNIPLTGTNKPDRAALKRIASEDNTSKNIET